MLDENIDMALADSDGLGRAKRVDGVHDRYIEFAKRTLPRSMSLSGLRIVIDCANGAAYKVAPAALWELGAEVITINVEPNGFNINEECGSTHPAGLPKKVHEVRADIGIALDGDADRVVIVDENGEIVDGDQIMALIARILAPGGPAVRRRRRRHRDVQSRPRALPRRHRAAAAPHQGRRPLRRRAHARARVECRRRAVRPHRAVGFLDHRRRAGLGAAGAGLHQAAEQAGERDLPKKFEPVPQLLKNVRFSGGKPLEEAPVKAAIEDARNRLGNAGRLVIRPSGTEPLIRVMAEGDDPKLVEASSTTLSG